MAAVHSHILQFTLCTLLKFFLCTLRAMKTMQISWCGRNEGFLPPLIVPIPLPSPQNPVPSFHLPLNLSDWFPQQRMKTKREEIKELILEIQRQQQQQQEVERREEPEQIQAPPTAGPGPGPSFSPSEEPDIQETCCGTSTWSPGTP